MEGSLNLKTAESIDLYALMVGKENFLVSNKNTKKSAMEGIEGEDEECPLSLHHCLKTDHLDW